MKAKFFTPVVILAVLQSAFAYAGNVQVMMHTDPPGARVLLDNSTTPSGNTPCVVEMAAGDHTVRFELDGYKTDAKMFTAKAGTTVKSTLTPLRALLTVKSIPSKAAIFVDGEEKGKTPLVGLQVDPGDHEILVELEGYAAIRKNISITLGQRETIDVKLEKSTEPAEMPEQGKTAEQPVETPAEQPADKPAGKPEGPAEETAKPGKPPKLIDVTCWACEGSGTIKTMGCPFCNCKGIDGANACGKCNGERRIAVTCKNCKGAGTLKYEDKQGKCAFCSGLGAPICTLCKGAGKLKRVNPEAYSGPTQTCPTCTGTGRDMHSKCKICGDKGTMSVTQGRFIFRYPCYYCKGSKEVPPHCAKCNGTGVNGSGEKAEPCQPCAGTGQAGAPCMYCRGAGWIPAPK